MNQTTLMIARSLTTIASQAFSLVERDSESNFSTVAPYLAIALSVCGLAIFIYAKASTNNISGEGENRDFNSFPLDVINSSPDPLRDTASAQVVTTPDMALPQPRNWRWGNPPLRTTPPSNNWRGRMEEGSTISEQRTSVDIPVTGTDPLAGYELRESDILDLTNHSRNLQQPLPVFHHPLREVIVDNLPL